jgi:uracil permease
MGPIVALIGLELGKVAAGMAGLLPDAHGARVPADMAIGLTTLALAIFGSLLFRGFLAVIPILLAVLGGYALAFVLGRVDLAGVAAEQVFSFPRFTGPIFDPTAILVITPAALVVLSEHIGHLFVTGNIVGRDLTRDPGLHRSLAGDGISTMLSGLVGSVPVTTYGENMGVMAITRVYSVWVIGGAAVISIAISFIKVLSNLLSTIPVPVMGGISMLLFGVIAASGIRMLVEAQVDYNRARNLILTAMVFMVGISEVSLQVGAVALKGMALATLTGMALSLVFHVLERLRLLEEEPRRPAPARASADAAPRRPELV